MENNIKLTQDAAPQPERCSTPTPRWVRDKTRGELVQITRRIPLLRARQAMATAQIERATAQLERATALRDELRRWLNAHEEA